MILLAGAPNIDASPSALTDASRRAPVRKKGPSNKASARPAESCLRCGGLLVRTYTASLELDLTGRPMEVWCCVNCGECVDHDILTNRSKGAGTARRRPRPRTGFQ
jgi:hypothetical protein